MSTSYIGNPTATEAPSAAPGPGIIPTVVVPSDGDPASASSVQQALRVPADFLAYYAFPGRVGSFRERWDIAAATLTSANTGVIADLAKRWQFVIGSGTTQTLVFQNPATATGGYSSRTVKADQGTGNASQISGLVTAFPVWVPPTSTYRCLLEFDLQATTSTLNSREWHLGWASGASGVNDVVGFQSQYNLANWQAWNGTTQTDTGIPVSVGSTWVRFGVLIDTTLATPSMLYYINGTLVATATSGLPAAGTALYLNFGGRQVSTGVCAFTVGAIDATWSPKF